MKKPTHTHRLLSVECPACKNQFPEMHGASYPPVKNDVIVCEACGKALKFLGEGYALSLAPLLKEDLAKLKAQNPELFNDLSQQWTAVNAEIKRKKEYEDYATR